MGDISTHFSKSEIECKCGCGYIIVHSELLQRLELVRGRTGFPMVIGSWCRCVKHNKDIGSKSTSSHISGEAVDIGYDTQEDLLTYLFWLRHFGFLRLILYHSHIHVDVSTTKTNPYFEIKKGVI